MPAIEIENAEEKEALPEDVVQQEKSQFDLTNVGRTVTSVSSVNFVLCRICQSANPRGEPLISPCNCKGSLAYVHLTCLERWLNESNRTYCELCMYRYNSVQTRRYKICESLKLWMGLPQNKAHIQSDILIAVLLTLVTLGLLTVCLMGMEYFVIEGTRIGISKKWTKGGLIIFLVVVILGYFATVYLLVRDQFLPWYNWWKRAIDVRLRLTPSIARGALHQQRREQRENREHRENPQAVSQGGGPPTPQPSKH